MKAKNVKKKARDTNLFPMSNTLNLQKFHSFVFALFPPPGNSLPGIFFGRDIVAFSILPKLTLLSFIIFNYSTEETTSSWSRLWSEEVNHD